MPHEIEIRLILSTHRTAFEFLPEFIKNFHIINMKNSIIPKLIFKNLHALSDHKTLCSFFEGIPLLLVCLLTS